MAKTESTAVNDLIKIAATQTPLRKDPSEDLMFTIPPKQDRSARQHALVPRGKDVAPLSRDRAPAGTSEHAIAMPAIKISSAPASASPPALPRTITPKSATIPPLPSLSTAAITAPEHLSDEPIATRATRPSLPPPTRASLPPPSRLVMPSAYPIVSAVHSPPLAPAPQPKLAEPDENASPWGDESLDVEVEQFRGDSTAQVAKQRTTLYWMIKLAPLAGAMIVLGALVGGYLVFDGQGGKHRDAAAASGSVEVKVVAEPADPVAVAAPGVDSPVIAAAAAEPASETAVAAVTPPNLAGTPTAVEPAANIAAPTAVEPAANIAAPTVATPTTAAPTAIAATVPTAPSAVPSIATTPSITTSITTPAPNAAAIARRSALVDVRIDSKPAGATVMLVDRGKQTFLGTTPISTAVDPSRAYDIVFAYPNRPTQVEHLDPKATNRLAVVLGKSGNRAKPELAKPATVIPAAVIPTAVTASAVKPVAAVKPAKIAKPKIVEPSWDTQIEKATKTEKVVAPPAAKPAKVETTVPAKTETAPPAAKAVAVAGTGVLMISSKPPCEIHIDGKSTGLMTPQRALPLAAGKHRITLVNPAQKIKKSVAVEITANESTKVIQDLTELMK